MPLSAAITMAFALVGFDAAAQTTGFVVIGRPNAPASRAALRLSESYEDREGLEVVQSDALRRALAGVPLAEGEEDPLADVRRLARRAQGEARRESLERLGGRLELERLVTVARVGEELELRVFDVPRSSFYRGTLMIPTTGPEDVDRLEEFLLPRLGAPEADQGQGEDRAEQPSRWRHWWIWAIVGGAVVAVAAVAYFADPGGGNDDVRLRIVAP